MWDKNRSRKAFPQFREYWISDTAGSYEADYNKGRLYSCKNISVAFDTPAYLYSIFSFSSLMSFKIQLKAAVCIIIWALTELQSMVVGNA